MAKNKRKKAVYKKILTMVFILATIAAGVSILKQLYDMMSLQKQVDLVEQQLQALKEENASLTSTKEKLEDPDYVQTYARGEYMFSKGDEKVFHLPSSKD